MSEELKPCPFCGCGEGNLYIVAVGQYGYDTVGIFCNGCKQLVTLEENECEGNNGQTRKKAIDAWNRRAAAETCDTCKHHHDEWYENYCDGCTPAHSNWEQESEG